MSTNKRQTAEPAKIEKLDQAAWEAPELQPTFTSYAKGRQEWPLPCPDWCLGDDAEGHQLWHMVSKGRRHQGPVYRVGVDHHWGYETNVDGVEGVSRANFEIHLQALSRDLQPRIALRYNYGDADRHRRQYVLPALYVDEVRELIAVLQHLLKVGQEGA